MTVHIPQQLRKKMFRFVKVRAKDKAAFEKNWETTANYVFDDPELLKYLENGGNYGIIGGYGNITLIDCDSQKLMDICIKKLPETMIVIRGGGIGHLYYICKDGENFDLNEGKEHLGEVRAQRRYVVGPGSIHPSGNEYKVVMDYPLAEVTMEQLKEAFKGMYRDVKDVEIPTEAPKEEPGVEDPYAVVKAMRQGKRLNNLLDGKFEEEGFQSNSEAEMAVVSHMKNKGLNFEQIDHIMREACKLQKWATAPEQYRLRTYGKARVKEEKKTEIGEPTADHMAVLTDPKLLDRAMGEVAKKVEGEKDTCRTIFVTSCGRFVTNADSFSTNLLVNDEGGLGKDYVADNTLGVWSKDIIVHKKRISETAFTYMHNAIMEPQWTWDDKIFYGEDLPNRVLNADSFKVMATSEKWKLNTSTIVIKGEAVDYGIQGKPCIIITMANANPKQELLRRFPAVNCDESIDQTKAIVRRHARFKAEGIKPEYDTNITEALKYLKPVKVRIPYAENLGELIQVEHHIMRTNFPRFCDFIMFSTALHQYQRETDEDGFILATKQDYDIASEIIRKVTSNSRSIPMTRKQRKIIDILAKTGPGVLYSVKHLLEMIPFLDKTHLYREMDKLTELGFVKRGNITEATSTDSDGNPRGLRDVTAYEYVDIQRFELPNWSKIEFWGNSGNGGKRGNSGKRGNDNKRGGIKKI